MEVEDKSEAVRTVCQNVTPLNPSQDIMDVKLGPSESEIMFVFQLRQRTYWITFK